MDTNASPTSTEGVPQDKQRCTNCKCFRKLSCFIGKKGDMVKRCQKCRDKDSRQKKRPDVAAKRNARAKEKNYAKIHRDRKRAENEEQFLRQNNERNKQWRHNNKAHVRDWKRMNINYRLCAIKQQALKKGITWDEATMTRDKCAAMMSAPCHYCRALHSDVVNGIDRMNGQGTYTETNCVPCCRNCNFIKKCLDPRTFLKRCSHISQFHDGPGEPKPSAWEAEPSSASYATYKSRAMKKGLPFELFPEDFNAYTLCACFYCGLNQGHVGIDRCNNELGYNTSNCVSCCRECNQMKADMSREDFVAHCQRVAGTELAAEVWEGFASIPLQLHTILKRTVHP